jgi:hypothetical protein
MSSGGARTRTVLMTLLVASACVRTAHVSGGRHEQLHQLPSSFAEHEHTHDVQCPPNGNNPFGHLSHLQIAAPADGSDVWGAFSVRIEFEHRVSPVIDPPEALPLAFDVMLDGDQALQVALKNSSRSFYLVHIPPLPVGPHLLQVALRYPGDDEQHSPVWVPLEQDRARYHCRGRERPLQTLQQLQPSQEHFNVTIRQRDTATAQGFRTETQRWKPEETAMLVVDMWKFHGCRPAMLRARDLVIYFLFFLSSTRAHARAHTHD